MLRRHFVSLLSIASVCTALAPSAPAADEALKEKVSAALERGRAFLRQQQKESGAWSLEEIPGLTALAVDALLPAKDEASKAAAAKGLSFIRQQVKPDGGLYVERLKNYNTSVCLTALAHANDPKDAALIEGARKLLVGAQMTQSLTPSHDGGFGYEGGTSPTLANGRPRRADLDNTFFALEALAAVKAARAGQEKKPEPDLNWQAAIDFVTRCQNLKSTNKEAWVSEDEWSKGGFIYTPGDAKTDEGSRFVSYGSMTYAGMMSLIYADLKADDVRVKAAVDWVSQKFTVDENPGKGPAGLYYYYHAMAKGLTAAGLKELTTKDGKKVDWKSALALKLATIQKPDGSWSNEEEARWMEKDPILATCYCVFALQFIHEGL
jgi:squalene-hopene/tetraprenyl-beta-curcumene cyclase